MSNASSSTYRNVIARFGPEAGERVNVGAHYDAAGPHPGADDNASGVAGPPAHRLRLEQHAEPLATSARVPGTNLVLALGVVRRDVTAAGKKLRLGDEQGPEVTVLGWPWLSKDKPR